MDNTPALSQDGPHPLDLAAKLVGGRAALADRLDVSVGAIGNWKSRGVPIEQCVPIERLTGGVVSRPMLRPNDWQDIWPELAGATLQAAAPTPAADTTDDSGQPVLLLGRHEQMRVA